MIIRIDGAKSGWSEYVLSGTKQKPRDPALVKVIDGDPTLGDVICASTDYKEDYYRIMLGFKGKVPDRIMEAAYDDFKRLFMYGFEEDAFHIDAVIHRDTENHHIHVRIPKRNLVMGTQLQLYIDKLDRTRKSLIVDYLDLKYDLESARDNRRMIMSHRNEYLDEWREEHGQQLLDLSSKKGRSVATGSLLKELQDLHDNGLVPDYDALKTAIEALDLKIVREGYDRSGEFHYLTVENETGKMRLKGEMFGPQFWENRNPNAQEASGDRQQKSPEQKAAELEEVTKQLEAENDRRLRRVNRRYATRRERFRTRQIQVPASKTPGGSIRAERKESEDDGTGAAALERIRERRKARSITAESTRRATKILYERFRADRLEAKQLRGRHARAESYYRGGTLAAAVERARKRLGELTEQFSSFCHTLQKGLGEFTTVMRNRVNNSETTRKRKRRYR